MSGRDGDDLFIVTGQEGCPGGTISQEGYVPRRIRQGYPATSGYKPAKDNAPPKVDNVKFVPRNPPKAD